LRNPKKCKPDGQIHDGIDIRKSAKYSKEGYGQKGCWSNDVDVDHDDDVM
jgi:hypothetical protein